MIDVDQESIPSDLSENQWAEINNYDFKLYQEQQNKHKKDLIDKKNLVRNTLNVQMEEQRQARMKLLDYNQKMDKLMIKNAKKELDIEKQQKLEQIKKMEAAKAQRDVMLVEAKDRRIKEIQSERNKEIDEVQKLRRELDKEKHDKLVKKKKEKEDAWKIIKENENVRQRK